MALVGTIAFVLLLSCVYLIARPFLIPELAGDGDTAQLREERARLLGSLHDLDMEFSTGKLAEVEFSTLRARREAELAAVEQALDDVEADLLVEADDELERAIAERRLQLAGPACPACEAPYDHDDRFCRACGADLTEVISR